VCVCVWYICMYAIYIHKHTHTTTHTTTNTHTHTHTHKQDLLAYLRLAVGDDDKAFERVLNKPKRGLGEQALEKLRHTQQRLKCSLFEAARRISRPEVLQYVCVCVCVKYM
jgi:hypothetical protein